jgi:hypothetical protein
MEDKKIEYFSLDEVGNFISSFISYLFRKWGLLVLMIAAGIALGVFYYSRQKAKYQAQTTFILEEKTSAGGGLAGLASQFGVNIGSSGGGNLFSGDNILNILKSKKVVLAVLLSKVDSTVQNSPTLADLYMEFTEMRKGWQKEPLLAKINFAAVKGRITPVEDSVLNLIYQTITKKNIEAERLSKQGSIIKVQVTSENSQFARLMTERLVDEAAQLYMNIKTGTAEANIQQLQWRADSLVVLLNRKSFTAAALQPIDINPAMRTAIVPTEIAGREKAVLAALYSEVVKNLEASKLLLSQQAPVIQLLDSPEYLLNNNKKGLVFITILSTFLIGFIYIVIAFIFFIRSKKRSKIGK